MTDNHLKTGGEVKDFQNKVNESADVNPKVIEVFKELKIRRKHRFLIFHITDVDIDIDIIGALVIPYCKVLKYFLTVSRCDMYVLTDQKLLSVILYIYYVYIYFYI